MTTKDRNADSEQPKRRSKSRGSPQDAVKTVGKRITIPPSSGKFLSTGCTILDLAVSGSLPGGFPQGRIAHIYGLESTAKTVFMVEPLGAAQRGGGKATYVDVEQTCDFERLPLFGVRDPGDPYEDRDDWAYRVPETIEELFETTITEALETSDPELPNAMGIDSLSALTSEDELQNNLSKGTYGTSRAKMLSKAFRKYIKPISDANLTLVFVDQSRDNVGAMFGPNEVVSGGKALKFYCSVRVHMSFAGRIKNAADIVIGAKFGFKIDKNKVSSPFREGVIYLYFDHGIDDIRTSIEWLQKHAVDQQRSTLHCRDCGNEMEVKKSVRSATKSCNKCGGRMAKRRGGGGYDIFNKHFRSAADAVSWVEDNDLEDDLEVLVEQRWQEIHAAPERKARKR